MNQTSGQNFLRENRLLINQFIELKLKIDAIPYCSLLAVQLENDLIKISFRLHSPADKMSDFEIDEIIQSELNKTLCNQVKQIKNLPET